MVFLSSIFFFISNFFSNDSWNGFFCILLAGARPIFILSPFSRMQYNRQKGTHTWLRNRIASIYKTCIVCKRFLLLYIKLLAKRMNYVGLALRNINRLLSFRLFLVHVNRTTNKKSRSIKRNIFKSADTIGYQKYYTRRHSMKRTYNAYRMRIKKKETHTLKGSGWVVFGMWWLNTSAREHKSKRSISTVLKMMIYYLHRFTALNRMPLMLGRWNLNNAKMKYKNKWMGFMPQRNLSQQQKSSIRLFALCVCFFCLRSLRWRKSATKNSDTKEPTENSTKRKKIDSN